MLILLFIIFMFIFEATRSAKMMTITTMTIQRRVKRGLNILAKELKTAQLVA